MSCSKKISSVGPYDSGMNIPPVNTNTNANHNNTPIMAGTVYAEPYKYIESITSYTSNMLFRNYFVNWSNHLNR